MVLVQRMPMRIFRVLECGSSAYDKDRCGPLHCTRTGSDLLACVRDVDIRHESTLQFRNRVKA